MPRIELTPEAELQMQQQNESYVPPGPPNSEVSSWHAQVIPKAVPAANGPPASSHDQELVNYLVNHAQGSLADKQRMPAAYNSWQGMAPPAAAPVLPGAQDVQDYFRR